MKYSIVVVYNVLNAPGANKNSSTFAGRLHRDDGVLTSGKITVQTENKKEKKYHPKIKELNFQFSLQASTPIYGR